MKWKKQGLIFSVSHHNYDWLQSHAMLPTAEHLEGDIYRVYFSGRDAQNRSHIGYVHINLKDPQRFLYLTEKPVLGLGDLGCFDDNGVTPSWVMSFNDKIYLYYIGWNKKSTVRMGLIAGLAVSEDKGKTFQRVSRAPLLERTECDPLALNTAPCVMREGNKWRMWYVSGVNWVHKDLPRYNIKYAESANGVRWKREGKICIDFKSDRETALARPCVLRENNQYKMWYSYKGETYRIGYAESSDGIEWKRKDEEAEIDVEGAGWDSKMIEYSYVIQHKGKNFMLYNGNDYGKEGFGLAIAEE